MGTNKRIGGGRGRMLRGVGMVGGLRGIRPMAEIGVMEPLKDVEQLAREDDATLAEWAERCGEQRAREAWQVRMSPAQGGRSTTLPELLAEAYLRRSGMRWEAQVNLGWAVPDFVVFTEGGAVVWRIQGEYWHGRPEAKGRDVAQKDRLLSAVVQGQPVTAVVDVWEADIYTSEAALEQALKGVQLRG